MYLVSVYFDEKTNRILQQYVDAIARATGNDFMIAHKVPPHMTISAIEARSVDVLRPHFEAMCTGETPIEPGEIRIMSIGQLLPYVFYAAPVMNGYLQGVTETVYDAFCNVQETTISKYYKPYSWLPHITLGKTLDKEQMQKAFAVMQELFAPITATVTEIGLAKVNPHEDVCRIILGD